MFGQNTAKTPFGSSTFGSNTAFGAQATTPFGQSSTGGLFGSKTPAAGGFGTPSFGAQTTGFGATSSTGTNLFGANTSTSGGLFGQQSGGAFTFNQPAQPSTGLFGSSNAFKTPQSTNVFGQTNSAFGGFGGAATTQASSTGLFGTPFGSTSTAPAAGTSLFGGTGFGATAATGTTVKFDPVTSQEQIQRNGTSMTIKGMFQSITAMSAYESKSLEELRWEDYSAGRKGGTTTAATTGLFGAAKPTTGLFGQTAGSTLGGFGQTQTAGTSLFGANPTAATQSGGLFGSKPVGTGSIFGGTSTAATSGFGGFGTQSTGGGLFGQTSTGTTGGLFGATSTAVAPTNLFGATTAAAAPSTGLFGSTAFGAQPQATSGLFGAAKPFAFNTPAVSTGFGLGATSSSSLFGNTAAAKPAFTFNNPGTSTFGTTTGTGLFGSTTTGGLFGQNKTGIGSTFGGTALGTGLTGATANPFGTTGLGLTTMQPVGTSLGQNPLALQQQQQILQTQLKALVSSPFGDSPLFRNIKVPTSVSNTDNSANDITKQKGTISSQYKVFSRPVPRPNRHSIASPSYTRSKLFDGLEDNDVSSPVLVPRRSVKKLVIKQSNNNGTKLPLNIPLKVASTTNDTNQNISVMDDLLSRDSDSIRGSMSTPNQKTLSNCTILKGDDLDTTVDLFNTKARKRPINNNEDISDTPKACCITLTRPEYFTIPSIDELNEMCDDENQLCPVKDFKVGRRGYGQVKFFGVTNVFGLDLDEIVTFRRCEVEVYPDSYSNKPEVGQELNKKSEINLEKVWATDKSSQTPIKSPNRLKSSGFLERLEEKTAEMGARFVDYQPDNGIWVFQVDHFTKYGLFEQLTSDPADKSMTQSIVHQTTIDQHEKLKDMLQKEREALSKSHQNQLSELSTEDVEFENEDIDVSIIEPTEPEQAQIDDVNIEEGLPTYQYARRLGLNASRVHEMKASFFDQTETTNEMNHTTFSTKSTHQNASRLLLSSEKYINDAEDTSMTQRIDITSSGRQSQLFRTLGAQSVASSPINTLLSSKKRLTTEIERIKETVPALASRDSSVLPPMSVAVKQQLHIIDPLQSVVRGKAAFVADASLSNSRRCRIGWTARRSLIRAVEHVSRDLTQSSQSIFSSAEAKLTPYHVKVSKIRDQSRHSIDTICAQLSIALKHSRPSAESQTDGGKLIQLSPLRDNPEITLQYSECCNDMSEGNQHDVWSLLHSLWGPLSGASSPVVEDYDERIARRDELTKWLIQVNCSEIDEEINDKSSTTTDHLGLIFNLLSGQRIADAARVASEHRDYRLSLLISQSCGDHQTRQLLCKQLSEWEQQKVDQYINDTRLKIFTILAGLMVWRSSDSTINACHGLNWKRTLALHLWFYCSATASVKDAIKAYRSAFEGTPDFQSYASFPFPSYATEMSDDGCSVKDVCYLLLSLYCDRTQSLETLLNPLTATDNALDWHLSWHLQQVLESLHYDHLNNATHDHIQLSYASQLETLGHWHWACFITMHRKNQKGRDQGVKDIIFRNCFASSESIDLTEKERFVVDDLNVPSTWIHEAKARHAVSCNYHLSAAKHFIYSEMWNEAHDIIINELAPTYIVNGDGEVLVNLLQPLTNTERASTVAGWKTGGQIYLDYVMIHKRLHGIEVKNVAVSGYLLEDIETELSSIITRVNRMTANTPLQRLSQAEIAKNSSDMLKLILREMASSDDKDVDDNESTPWPSSKIANHLAGLPLPPDYCLRELKELVRNYAREVTIAKAAS